MNQENLKRLREELTRDEGQVLRAYKDSLGYWTIGVGHLVDEDGQPRMTHITQVESQALLTLDIEEAYKLARKYVHDLLYWADDDPSQGGFRAHNQSRARALVNMAFNLGTRLGEFKKFLAAVNAHDWQRAAEEMMDSRWAKQVGPRAARLRAMILTND